MQGYSLVFTEQYTRRAAQFLKRHTDLRQHYLKIPSNVGDHDAVY